jgi:hypothetical protein
VFLNRFAQDLLCRRQVLDDALNAAVPAIEESRPARPDALTSVNLLLKALKDQQTAVIHISRRVADLWETMRRQIKPRMPGEDWDLTDATESALEHAKKKFEDFQVMRRKALAQRDTNADQFKDPSGKTTGFTSKLGTDPLSIPPTGFKFTGK